MTEAAVLEGFRRTPGAAELDEVPGPTRAGGNRVNGRLDSRVDGRYPAGGEGA